MDQVDASICVHSVLRMDDRGRRVRSPGVRLVGAYMGPGLLFPSICPSIALFKARSRPTRLFIHLIQLAPVSPSAFPITSYTSKPTCPTTENQPATTAAKDAPHTTPATTAPHTRDLHTRDPPTKNTAALPTNVHPTKASAAAPTTAALPTPAPLPLPAHHITPLRLSPTAGSRNGNLASAAHSSSRPLLAGLSGRFPRMLRMGSSRAVVASPTPRLCRRRIRPMRVVDIPLSIPLMRATVVNTPRRRRRRRAIQGSTLLRVRLGWLLVLLAERFWVMSLVCFLPTLFLDI